ncbi:histidine-containing phosphotransfer protein 1-like [Solanum tuberosum]|uniref:histidine-containing phosphotransfer protein 1-like n=1 Tax=Solanum tuberosum TaxID=4113 RepID=UPI00073A32F0|nr:PREDICTED: histidine-containing phosphotransfer protein 1-like [Solanum tuberosum]
MALSILKEIQLSLLNQMLQKGLINNEFEHLMISKRAQDPQSVVQTIEEYCAEVEAILSQMKNDIDTPEVDFSHLMASCELVKDKSIRIGSVLVSSTCMLLIRACDERNKRKFSLILELLKNDFSTTQSQLEAYARMERRIIIVQLDEAGSSSF